MRAGVQHTARQCADTPALIAESVANQPPYTNRGVGLTNSELTHRCDYLTGTTRESLETVRATLNEFFHLAANTEWIEQDYGGYFYKNRCEGPYGARIYYTHGREDSLVWLPGKACEFLNISGIISISTLLSLSVTRLDWCFDGVAFKPRDVWDAFMTNNVNTKVLRQHGSSKFMEDSEGHTTAYIGSRSGLAQIVCYDMRGFNRLELRTKGERAKELLAGLGGCADQREMAKLVMGHITGFCDFVERDHTNVSRSSRLAWWADFVGSVEKIRLSVKTSVQSAQEFVEKVPHRISTTVYTYVEMLAKLGTNSREALEHLYWVGHRRAKPKHKALLAATPLSWGLSPF